MPTYRKERIAELVHAELAQRLRLDIKDPRVGEISITRVEMSKDLKRATVNFLPLGGGEPTPDLREALADAAKRLRGPIGRALGIRHAPEIVFVPDRHTEAAVRVTSLLQRIARDREPEAPETDDDPGDDEVKA